MPVEITLEQAQASRKEWAADKAEAAFHAAQRAHANAIQAVFNLEHGRDAA